MEITEEEETLKTKFEMRARNEPELFSLGKKAGKALATWSSDYPLPWIEVAPDAPYFVTETGEDWTPIGQNDAITWPDFANAFRRKDMAQVEGHLAWLAHHGVTCLRFMLEYAQTENRYFERPAGKFQPNMVQLWDDLFTLCGKYNLRILLTPVDTFWMWIRWKHHPYNRQNNGPCAKRNQWLLCPETRDAIKHRFTFVAGRWGGSGVLFAWDLWNEIHPAHANYNTGAFYEFISDLSTHLRETEMRLYGKTHPQTVSLYGPVLDEHPDVADVIFRHPSLDFASTHFYDSATINHPKNTVDAAICTGKLMREALRHLPHDRPFFDSEHGPIHAFKDLRRTLPKDFDDEYFRYMQWAHLASGGAGGGMRWPNRHPHCLTHGMRLAQKSMAEFVKLLDWKVFKRRNLNHELQVSETAIVPFGCSDGRQAIVWLLRKDILRRGKPVRPDVKPLPVTVMIPGMETGTYRLTTWDTKEGTVLASATVEQEAAGDMTIATAPVRTDVALALKRIG